MAVISSSTTSMRIVAVLTLLSAGLLEITASDGNKTAVTCKGGTFAAGETAFVTCYFQKNIAAEQLHVYVGQTPFRASAETRSLACFKTSSKGLECYAEDGFYFNQEISDQLTLEIPKVSSRFAGTYSCRQIPPGDGITIPCNLTVNETEASKDDRPEHDRKDVIVITVTTAASVVAFIACVLLVVASQHRAIKKKRNGQSGSPNDGSDEVLLEKATGYNSKEFCQTSLSNIEEQDTTKPPDHKQNPDPGNTSKVHSQPSTLRCRKFPNPDPAVSDTIGQGDPTALKDTPADIQTQDNQAIRDATNSDTPADIQMRTPPFF